MVSSSVEAEVSERPRVLFVDDEPTLLRTFERNFRKHFLLRCVSSAAEALEALAREPFDIVVSDFAMPEMNGLELFERVAAEYPAIVRVLATAHAQAAAVREAKREALVAAVIEKPWTRETVLDGIHAAFAPRV